jgi:GDPmannose 4,6-dehydratase
MAKATAFWEVANYREAYGLYACSGLLFNHESSLRPQRFVTQKVVAAVCRMAAGDTTPLVLGDLSIQRDWGWAPEYIVAMHQMLQLSAPEDFVVCTGQTHSLEEFVQAAFGEVGLDWKSLVRSDPSIRRPSDIHISRGNPGKAKAVLGWEARYRMSDVVRMMVKAQLEATGHPVTS